MIAALLAQTPPPDAPLITLDRIFWFSVLAIFLITLIGAILRRITKDKCLKFLGYYHVTYLSDKRPTLWGDLVVSSQGFELLFDQAFVTRRGLVKTSALIYEDEYPAFIALARTVHGLDARDRKIRQQQVQRTFSPGFFRRLGRNIRNGLNTLRDAFSKVIALLIGRFTAAGAGTVVKQQAGDITNISGTVVALAANAYEPLLERYIGKRVVLEVFNPPGVNPPRFELPGYLVDYTPRFLAVFNVDHTPLETFHVTLDPNAPASPSIPGLAIVFSPSGPVVTVTGDDAYVLRRSTPDGQTVDFALALLPGSSITLPAHIEKTTLDIERTRQIDLVVPRARARIRFGAEENTPSSFRLRRIVQTGLAPLLESSPRE